jgi:hypothetical protein
MHHVPGVHLVKLVWISNDRESAVESHCLKLRVLTAIAQLCALPMLCSNVTHQAANELDDKVRRGATGVAIAYRIDGTLLQMCCACFATPATLTCLIGY